MRLTGKVGATLRVDSLANSAFGNRCVLGLYLGVHGLVAISAQDARVQVADLVEQGRVGSGEDRGQAVDTQFGTGGVLNRVQGLCDTPSVVAVARRQA